MEVLKWVLIILGICLALGLVTILLAKITVKLNFLKQRGKKPTVSFEVLIFGKPFKKQMVKMKKSRVKKQEESKEESCDDISFLKKTKLWYNNFLIFKDVYKKNSTKIRKTINATKIHFNIEFGTGDAAKTGILTGAVWAGIYNVISFISRLIRITEPKVNVSPEFNQRLCSFDGECIIKARVVNLIRVILSVGISYYFVSKKYKKKAANNYVNTH